MPELTQDQAMEAALLDGTLPDEDRRAPDVSVTETDIPALGTPHVPLGAPLFQGVPGDVAASLVHFDQVKRAKEDTGYAQTAVLDALINLLTRHQPQ